MNTSFKKFFPHLMIAVLLIPAISLPVAAADRYVSDVMHIPLRRAPSMQQPVVVNALPSGTKLTLIREELDSSRVSWSLVSTADGAQGWVRTQYLVTEPTAARQLAELLEQHSAVSRELEQLRQSSARAVDIEQENQRLHEGFQLLQTRADVLQAENDYLKNNDRHNQWLYGGGLLLLGVILSFILQAFGRRKRPSEWR